jgi:hypothetical protein
MRPCGFSRRCAFPYRALRSIRACAKQLRVSDASQREFDLKRELATCFLIYFFLDLGNQDLREGIKNVLHRFTDRFTLRDGSGHFFNLGAVSAFLALGEHDRKLFHDIYIAQ